MLAKKILLLLYRPYEPISAIRLASLINLRIQSIRPSELILTLYIAFFPDTSFCVAVITPLPLKAIIGKPDVSVQ
jgi:hypothetical protein